MCFQVFREFLDFFLIFFIFRVFYSFHKTVFSSEANKNYLSICVSFYFLLFLFYSFYFLVFVSLFLLFISSNLFFMTFQILSKLLFLPECMIFLLSMSSLGTYKHMQLKTYIFSSFFHLLFCFVFSPTPQFLFLRFSINSSVHPITFTSSFY